MKPLSDEVYQVLKYVTMIAIPALTVFYVAVAAIWNFPFADEVAKTSAAVVALLSALLQMSSAAYNKALKG